MDEKKDGRVFVCDREREGERKGERVCGKVYWENEVSVEFQDGTTLSRTCCRAESLRSPHLCCRCLTCLVT